ncbi:MAG: DUF456 domain-containing protein [Rikenellaceae bacterium]
MDIALSILALLLSMIGIIGAIIPIPGIIFSYAALICVYFCGYSGLTVSDMVIWAVVSVVVSIIDFWLPPFFTKKFGGSNAGVIGSMVGLVAGLIFFPPVGIIVGPMFGAILGELIHDKSDIEKAFKIGLASFAAFIFGTGLKLIAALWMLWVFLSRAITFISETLF